MSKYSQIFFIVIVFMLSGCLQEPAVIEGSGNYYIDGEERVAINRRQYINKNKTEQDDGYIFEDEKPVKSDKKSFDPYQNDAVKDSYQDDDIEFDDSKKQVSQNNNLDVKNGGDIDWNNIFNDVKKKPEPQNSKIENKVNVMQKQDNSQKQIKKPEIDNIKKSSVPKKNDVTPEQKKQIDGKIPQVVANKKVETKVNESKLCCIKRPANGAIKSRYGKSNDNELDDGMTFEVSDKNIISSGSGKVIYVDGENSSKKTIIIKHDNGLISSYSYNGTLNTGLNREVKAGQIIGAVNEQKNILYFTIRNNGKTINPENIMR